jgi:hypothetical protein
MPIAVVEKTESRERSREQETRKYVVRGTADAAEAQAEVLAVAPAAVDGWARQVPTVRPVMADPLLADESVWEAEVVYRAAPGPKALKTGEKHGQLQIGSSGSLHITSVPAEDHIADHALPGKDILDSKGLLGWDGEKLEGADIDEPQVTWSETHVFANEDVTDAYIATLIAVKFKPINDTAFRGFNAGEVKFLGVSGGSRDGQDVELTFEFAARPNRTGVQFGGVGVNGDINVGGWEHVSIDYTLVKDATAKRLVPRATNVHIDRLYQTSDFSTLGIGVAGNPIFPAEA